MQNLDNLKTEIISYYETNPDPNNYMYDCTQSVSKAKAFFDTCLDKPNLCVVIGVDDAALCTYNYYKEFNFARTEAIIHKEWELTNLPANQAVLDFVNYARSKNAIIRFLTCRPYYFYNKLGERVDVSTITVNTLHYAGYGALPSDCYTYLKNPDDTSTNAEYKATIISELQSQGLYVAVNIGDQDSDFENTAIYSCRLPNPMYVN